MILAKLLHCSVLILGAYHICATCLCYELCYEWRHVHVCIASVTQESVSVRMSFHGPNKGCCYTLKKKGECEMVLSVR